VTTGTRILSAAAVAWGALLLFLAVVFPVETDENSNNQYSLVHVNGYGVLWLAGLPLAAAMVVWLLLHARVGPAARRRARAVAWILSVSVLAAAVAGFVTFIIGLYVVPMGMALVGAVVSASQKR
jgi:uncharacterized membrane protein